MNEGNSFHVDLPESLREKFRSLERKLWLVDTIIALCRECRPESTHMADIRDNVAWGPGTRAAQALSLACRARAMLFGRFAPSIEDIEALAVPVLRHRFGLTYGARAEGFTARGLITNALDYLQEN